MADTIELGAIERLMGNEAARLTMSSTKSATGHLLGAAGAIEAIFSLLAIRDSMVPPTLNLDNPERETVVDLVPHTAKKKGSQCRAVELVSGLAGRMLPSSSAASAECHAILPQSPLTFGEE